MKIIEKGPLTLVRGISASGIHCGIKSGEKRDLALIYSDTQATAAGVFTSNIAVAAPVIVSRETLHDNHAQAIVINSGVANAATGEKGIEDARQMAKLTASALKVPPDSVIVASTGRIGRFLPMEKIASGIHKAVSSLSKDGGEKAAEAILTTDTFSKQIAVQIEMAGSLVTLAGMAKGAGMIRPDMATMLAFLVTDANVTGGFLGEVLKNAVKKTFNRISVDGDTSTNDMVIILANGKSGSGPITSAGSEDADKFIEAVEYICQRLSLMIVSDGEGATKLIRIDVLGARTETDASKIAFRIAESPLVKTSFYGKRCNWGRLIAAAGAAGVPIDPQKIDIFYGSIQVVGNGVGLGLEKEKEAETFLLAGDINIRLDLHLGEAAGTVWTTDLSPDYIHINADYIS
ncbi:MAG: bifunctional glutamate N-acetyltransferase/amino-acid acetyltransferase ArgJ [bacterium]